MPLSAWPQRALYPSPTGSQLQVVPPQPKAPLVRQPSGLPVHEASGRRPSLSGPHSVESRRQRPESSRGGRGVGPARPSDCGADWIVPGGGGGGTVRCARAVRKLGYFGRVFPNGRGDRNIYCVPMTRTTQILTQSKNSDNELKETVFHTENARLLSKSAVFALRTYGSLVVDGLQGGNGRAN